MAGRTEAEARGVEYAKCAADAAYFIDAYGVIDDAQGLGEGGGTTPFKLWPAQVRVAWTLMTERLTIILKARQLGISWLCCGYALWLCMFSPGKVVLLFSQGQDEADELLRRINALYDRLPQWMRDASPLAKAPNTTRMSWANGSFVKSLPATKNAGSSWTASLVIVDEAAKIQWADELYTAMKPTIDGGGQLVVLSTAKGVGNLFHRIWVRAVQGINGYKTVFLAWWERPGRNQAWRAAKIAEEDDPEKVKQEYPESANEAFLVSGRTRFHPDWIAAQSKNVRKPLDARLLPPDLARMDGLEVFKLPGDINAPTLISADVAEGLEHGDFSDASILDPVTWEEYATLHGKWEPDEFAERLHTLSLAYDGDIVVERNNHGHAVISKLNSLGSIKIADGHDGRPGWLTNVQTKPQAIDALAVALRDGLIAIRCAAVLDELQVYTINPDGKTSAPEGYHDDRVMSRAIGLGWLQLVGGIVTSYPEMPDYRG